MNCAVRTWLLGAISDNLADKVSERDASARVIWLESQFLGNRTTRALYVDQEFRAFTQGDLSVVDYCRRFKRMAEDLCDLGQPVSDETLVLDIVRRLNERFRALGLHIRRTTPLPSFLQVRDDLRLEEITMAKGPPATALTAFSNGGSGSSSSGGGSGGSKPPVKPPQQQQQQSRRQRGGKRWNKEAKDSASQGASTGGGGITTPGGALPPGGYTYRNPWTGAIFMWPGPQVGRPSAPQQAPLQQLQPPQTYIAGPPGQWAGQWGVPPAASPPSLAQGWDQQSLASNFQTMTLQQPPQHEWYFDTGATSHMASDSGILSSSSAPSSHCTSSIIVGNGNLLPVTSTSTTVLPHKLYLNNVLVSPNLIKNLISVRQFTTDNNCSVEFDPFGCSVKDLSTRNEIVRCDSSGPLYPLQLSASALLANTSTLWHQRLGHPVSFAVMFVFRFMRPYLAPRALLSCYIVIYGHHQSLVFRVINIIL
ncbi:uncharacterized protein LOC120651088 [Panicum virgatum]|uniref:uncharacterized protein LOC120651088 n=1 Tax=Panicum virgatum TaxID=38727 RepID=UPI0019D621B5|nr:uncharacterized protein LOC120651088 [Panicum virgatum]XP_039784387.1 uncharacterized protein LOC120651088 [Panicum virgatum]